MSKKRRRWPAIVALSLILLVMLTALVGFLAAPTLVRHYITSHYPGVSVGGIDIRWGEQRLILRNVKVERPNLHASLILVEVDRQKNVQVDGGTVDLTLGESSDKPSESGMSVVASNLVVTLHYHEAVAELQGTRINKDEVCFDYGTVSHPKGRLEVNDACVKRDKSFAKAHSIEVPITLPFAIPDIDPEQKVTIEDVEVEPEKKLVRFGKASTSWMSIYGPASVGQTNDRVFLKTPKIEVTHAWLAPHPVSFEDVDIEAPAGILKKEPGTIDVTLGAAHVRLDPTNKAVSGDEPCNTWFDVFPKPLPEAMQKMQTHFTGNLDFEIRVKPTPKIELHSTCRFDCSMPPISEILNKPKFTYSVYNSKNEIIERETGPMTTGWVGFGSLPPHVTKAFVLLEDPGFPEHRGVIAQALENSLKINIASGTFTRGGSTITMQLARNLWLNRYKSLGRKAEEALIAYALESCLPKEKILEMYVNVIEFGPDVYGIGPAAAHYFHKDASDLTPEEAFYLASILPSPRKALPPKQGGLARAKGIMKALANSGYLSDYLIEDDKPSDTTGWDLAP